MILLQEQIISVKEPRKTVSGASPHFSNTEVKR